MSTRLLQCLTSFKNYIGQEGVNGEWTEKKPINVIFLLWHFICNISDDHSRVPLVAESPSEVEYINACYIDVRVFETTLIPTA